MIKRSHLEEGMATHSRMLAWRIPWLEEPGRLWSIELQRVGHNWSNLRKWKWLSHVRLFVILWTTQSTEFSRPEYLSGWPFPSPGDLPTQGLNPSLIAGGFFTIWATRGFPVAQLVKKQLSMHSKRSHKMPKVAQAHPWWSLNCLNARLLPLQLWYELPLRLREGEHLSESLSEKRTVKVQEGRDLGSMWMRGKLLQEEQSEKTCQRMWCLSEAEGQGFNRQVLGAEETAWAKIPSAGPVGRVVRMRTREK